MDKGIRNQYYRPYLKEVLTSSGIIVTDGPNNDYAKTVPNDDRVVILLREAVSLWNSNNRNGFLELFDDSAKRKDYDIEEISRFSSTIFPDNSNDSCDRFKTKDGKTCISWILEAISIEESIARGNDIGRKE